MLDRALERVADMPAAARDDKAATQQLLLQLSGSLLAKGGDERPARRAEHVVAAASQLVGTYALWFAKTADAPVEAALRYLLRALGVRKVSLQTQSLRLGIRGCFRKGRPLCERQGCYCNSRFLACSVMYLVTCTANMVGSTARRAVWPDTWAKLCRCRRHTQRHSRSAACATGAQPSCGGRRRSLR